MWDEAEEWFDRAEREYGQTLDADVGLAQVAFARIGLLYHRYKFAEALENARRLSPILDHLGMHSRAAKCELAAAMALKALGRRDEAIVVCERLLERRREHMSPSVLLHAYAHLADAYKDRGRIPETERCLQEGASRLALCDRSIAAADFQMVYADYFRARGDFATAAEIFRQAKDGYSAMGMRPFAAYASVLLAETLMMLDRRAPAEAELYWALPVLEELEMLPEGCAAVALLQEALRLRRLDPDILRAFRTSLKM
jgi:tetratricopeptide (TPR) repeat protein